MLKETRSGGLWSWGVGEWGRLGNGTRVDKWAPFKVRSEAFNGCMSAVCKPFELSLCLNIIVAPLHHVSAGTRVRHVSAGACNSAALTEAGEVWAWGLGTQGALGISCCARYCFPCPG